MSLVDPDAARREREARTPTASDLYLPAAVTLVAPAIAAFLLMRMVLNAALANTFDWASILAIVAAVMGMASVIFSGIRWFALSARNPRLLSPTAAAGLALLGVATGLSVSAAPPAWVRPPMIDWIVGSVAALGIVALVLAVGSTRRRIRRMAFEDEVMRSSAPVTGCVTNQGYALPPTEARALVTQVTYMFEDAAGTRRFAKLWSRMPADDLIVTGERVDLWFAADDPSDQKRIVVRRRPEAAR